MKALLLLLAGGLIPCCSSPQSQATGALKRMKAENYFTQTIQIELAKAAEQGNVAAIDKAISMGADVNKVGKEEMTPLAWAISKQNKAGYKRLLEKGANPNFMTKKVAWNNQGTSVMQIAASAEEPDYLRLALKHGGNPNGADELPGHRVLNTAIRNHRQENVTTLVKAGADINHQDNAGFTPIMHAHFQTQYDMVFLLMQMGADLKIRPKAKGADGKEHTGKTLAELLTSGSGDRGIKMLNKEREQREWYNKVVAELKRRGLM